MLTITEGNETKHQQQVGRQDTTTQRDAAARAPSQCLSARAMGAKERWEKDTTIKMVFLFLRRGRPSLSMCSITGCQGKIRAHDAAARAPSQCLSACAMGAKERWEKDTTIKMVFLFLRRGRPSLSVCSITGCQGKMRARDAAARASSPRLSANAMGAKKRWEKDTTIKLVFSFAKDRATFSQRMLNHQAPRKDESAFFSAHSGHKDTTIKKRAARDHQVCCHFSFYIFISEPK